MEPPCEHGGVFCSGFEAGVYPVLQWSRRVNTAECCKRRSRLQLTISLQWSRRVNTAECRGSNGEEAGDRTASMEPPCEHGGVLPGALCEPQHLPASMEPPCEHGGVTECEPQDLRRDLASMEPPCEHGGVWAESNPRVAGVLLQWSRRVNTAECYPS